MLTCPRRTKAVLVHCIDNLNSSLPAIGTNYSMLHKISLSYLHINASLLWSELVGIGCRLTDTGGRSCHQRLACLSVLKPEPKLPKMPLLNIHIEQASPSKEGDIVAAFDEASLVAVARSANYGVLVGELISINQEFPCSPRNRSSEAFLKSGSVDQWLRQPTSEQAPVKQDKMKRCALSKLKLIKRCPRHFAAVLLIIFLVRVSVSGSDRRHVAEKASQ
ncbi:hypothetical protein BGZ63DRAFT_270278 [Mariannaea sp. PMI_226]|nr:hypothetical protein BGZ63DRAFT_270278 [Mariannaea sp. PMI_226]